MIVALCRFWIKELFGIYSKWLEYEEPISGELIDNLFKIEFHTKLCISCHKKKVGMENKCWRMSPTQYETEIRTKKNDTWLAPCFWPVNLS